AMRCVERRDLADALEPGCGKIHFDMRNRNAVSDGGKQALLQPIGLRLHAIDEDTPCLRPIEAPPLIDVPRRRISSLSGIGGRKDLVALASDRLKNLPPPQSCTFGHDAVQFPDIHVPPYRR